MKIRIAPTTTRRSLTARKRAVQSTRPGVALGINVGKRARIRIK